MSSLKIIPQVSSATHTKSHTDAKSVRLYSNCEEGKNSNLKRKLTTTKQHIAAYNIRTMETQEKELELIKCTYVQITPTQVIDRKE